MAPLLFLIAMVLPFAWFASEFQVRVWMRLALGVCAMVGVFSLGWLADIARRSCNHTTVWRMKNCHGDRCCVESGRVGE
jgi:hypothetical protein